MSEPQWNLVAEKAYEGYRAAKQGTRAPPWPVLDESIKKRWVAAVQAADKELASQGHCAYCDECGAEVRT